MLVASAESTTRDLLWTCAVSLNVNYDEDDLLTAIENGNSDTSDDSAEENIGNESGDDDVDYDLIENGNKGSSDEADATSEEGGEEGSDSENEDGSTSGYGVEDGDDSEDLSFEEHSEIEDIGTESDEGISRISLSESKSDSETVPKNKTSVKAKRNTKIKPKTRNKKNKSITQTTKRFENAKAKAQSTSSQPTETDEYNHDSSDEEDIRNTVGNIPMRWYDEYTHLGYDWEGKKILKPPQGDELDNFLRRMEDPNFWRTVKDPQTGQDVVLCDADVDVIQRIQSQKIPNAHHEEYAPWIEWFSSEVMKTPLRKFPDHKRSFLPSKSESEKVSRIVYALKMGWIKPREEKKAKTPNFYMLWNTDDSAEHMRRIHSHIPAPKRRLPGHAESYNPPPEYLFDKRELKQWHKHKTDPWKRKLHFIPQKYGSLRQVPAYTHYMRERFLRCLDLYMCPREVKMKLTIEPEELVPQLPNPRDLQPYPTVMSLVYEGHTDIVRSISIEPKGQYIVSGSDDLTIKVWEVSTARCVRTIPAGGVVRCVSWCPNQALCLIAVAADRKVLLINPGVGDHLTVSKTDTLLKEAPPQDFTVTARVKAAVQWEEEISEDLWDSGIRIIINHFKEVRQVTWHGRGDYFSTVMPEGLNRSVLIHQLSKRRSQIPFNKSKGLVQCVLFHPIRPIFFVATQRNVRVYDLVKQELIKKLLSNAKWISSMAIHHGGDNILVGTYDRKMLWFDLDLSTKPYQTLRLHGTAVRAVAYHKRYPLFASGSDDRSVIVCHGMVYNDLLQNPLIVPLKRLNYHKPMNDFGVLDLLFHPTQPWVFSSGGDCTIRLYT
uniref:Ribosome biogenesis protein BOP1 homolog n=1 Tax=Timema cristinae TaxID=61476 RepID=A0A7R9CX83_TIMCR|nr:unnamed protein product [Timema cristinae]